MREEMTILGLNPAMAGGLFGLLLGIISFVALRMVASQVEINEMRETGNTRGSTTAAIIRFVALFDLFLFPAVGYFVGPIIAG
jgi:hypothetical protein